MKPEVFLLALAVAGAGCSSGSDSGSNGAPAAPDLRSVEIVDLSHRYDDETLYWPTSPSDFELRSLHYGPTEAGFFYSANAFSTPEHGGTHLDAPIHFDEEGWSTEQIPLERLVGPAVVLDVSAKAAVEPDYLLSVEDVGNWELEHGRIPVSAIVLLRTGWSERWPDAKAYLGDDTPGDASNLHFPGFSEEAVRFLTDEREIAVLGIDTASIDHGPSKYFLAHQAAAAANVPALENLTGLDQVPATGAWVAALPMKIAGGSGGPARVVAFVPGAGGAP